MTNEIKEILENIKKCCDITKDQSFTVYQRQDILKLLDYITNLQEENMRLISENETIKNIKYVVDETIYKTRITKAIDKLYCYGEVFDSKIMQQFQKEMLGILQGEDN